MPASNPLQTFGAGSVNEDMKGVTSLLEDALAGAPHNHTVSNVRCFLNHAPGQRSHGIGIEQFGHGPGHGAPH
jgi:hypothetical protein